MAVKIVTDSSADIPPDLLKELGITVVSLYVRFGEEVFKVGVDINNEDFYTRLVDGNTFPNTIQPSPMDFKQAYDEVARDADGIVSIHLSEKFSGTYQSAKQAAEMMADKCPVTVINSESMTIGLGMICITAARAAKNGATLEETVKVVKNAIPEIHFLALFDSLKYLAKGGRIGKAQGFLGTMLNIKPLLSMKDGEVVPVSKVRSVSKGLDQLYSFMANALKDKANVKELAIMYNTTLNEAKALAERIAPLYPIEKIIMGQIGPILGAHAGPNLIVIGIRGILQAGS
jgi:DegV family protein with EDD domain